MAIRRNRKTKRHLLSLVVCHPVQTDEAANTVTGVLDHQVKRQGIPHTNGSGTGDAISNHPLAPFAGMFEGDPTWRQVEEAIARNRRELDEEMLELQSEVSKS